MLPFLIILFYIIAFLFIYLILNRLYRTRLSVLSRLDKMKGQKNNLEQNDELEEPFYHRIIKPLGENISSLIYKATPGGIKNRLDERVTMAGNPFGLGVNGWLLIKTICNIVIPIISIVCIILSRNYDKSILIGIITAIIILYFFPNVILGQMTKHRQKNIINSLPDVLDLLTVSVEAGLSFDGAVSRLTKKLQGPLPDEFSRVLNEIKMGKSRKIALKDMSSRCGVADLTTFIGSIIQADELGVGISNVLRVQSGQMRQKRRQRAQEKAMKAPIKMLFPLVFFIFPTIFAVLLGPAMIKMMNEFVK